MTDQRADRAAAEARERGLGALLVTDLVNLRYLTGFTGTNGMCVVGPDTRLFMTDFRYVEQAARQVPDFDRVRGKQDLLEEVAARLTGRVGFEDDHLTVRQHERLRDLVADDVELVPAGGLVEGLRAVKEPEELRAIREAAALADAMHEYVRERGLARRTERDVALDLEHEMRRRGAEGPSFPTIVAGGAHGALPHASPRREEIPAGTLAIVDVGCTVDGYCSDCTRTYATGPLEDEALAVYDLVLKAQAEGLGAVRAGADCRDVDSVARDVIGEGGHAEDFGHGLGHGVGLQVHEGPRLSQTADGDLVAGNVVTVEPGVYVAGAFGVRIEDLVAVTDDGCEILSRFPKSLITLGA